MCARPRACRWRQESLSYSLSENTRETCRRISFDDFALRDIDQMLRALIRRHRKAASSWARRSFGMNTSPPNQCSLDRERIPGASSRWPFVDAPRTICLSPSRCFRPQKDNILFTPWKKALKQKKHHSKEFSHNTELPLSFPLIKSFIQCLIVWTFVYEPLDEVKRLNI